MRLCFRLQNLRTSLPRILPATPTPPRPHPHEKEEEEVPGLPLASSRGWEASLGPVLGTRPRAAGVARSRERRRRRRRQPQRRGRASPLAGDSARPARPPHPHAQAQSRCRPGSCAASGFRNSPADGLDLASSEVRGAAGPKPRRPPPAASSVSRRPRRSGRRAPGEQPPRCWGVRGGRCQRDGVAGEGQG